MYCQVIVDIVHENVAKPYTYLVPDGMELSPGQRVAVPFGRMEKEGVVTALSEDTDVSPEKLRQVLRPLEDYAAIPPELMALAREMAEENHCPMAETLRLMLPAQMRGGRIHPRTEKTARLAVSREEAEAAITANKRGGKRNELLRLLSDGNARTVKELEQTVRDPRDALKKLQQDGLIELYDAESLRTPGSSFTEVKDPGYTLTPGQREALDEILPALTCW